ncbi:MAG TPA: ATP-binding protein [Candidatus Saccharimonadales bacterium]|nr:ATP-binding protein [Candidatus Saccharimonadales bacterium]
MPDQSSFNTSEIRKAFAVYERRVRIINYKVGCALAFIFMLAGVSLDYFVYNSPGNSHLGDFFKLRLMCSALLAVVWFLLQSEFGIKLYRLLGFLVAFLPLVFISGMIYETDGPNSPYYAGLNLVMLGAALLLRWTLVDSILVFVLSLTTYFLACQFSGTASVSGNFFNNAYFLFVTGVFVITGSWFYNRIRFREFALRYALDKNKQELEETNRKLIELDRLKSRFFANISHELRTPLTLLLSPLETLLQRFAGKVDDVHELLLTMHSNGMRLLKLINDLLDLIRMEAGRMEIKNEPMEVTDFIKGLASAARQVAEDKQIKLETYTDLRLGVVAADPDKLEKVVLNLLFNALKFTPSGGRVELRAEKQAEEFVIIVSDTGIGIAEKNLPFVFDRFWQADSSAQRKYQGVGIGLALVKELTEMMRGIVDVESQEGKGTTFTVRLPYQKAELRPKSETDASTETGVVAKEEWLANLYRRAELFPAMSSLRGAAKPVELGKRGRRPMVLLADDEPDMRRFLRTQLDKDYDVLEAADGVQALEKATQFLPDIILLDMMMPEMDGLAVCQELRKHEDTAAIPIILLTARADEETKFNALELGANDFLAKPFSSNELHARIKNLVESHDFQRKLSKQNESLSDTIEQLKETELQLVQSEKLASLGRMSAGIIHEINNPLNFATTGLFALRNKSKQLAPAERREYEEILNDVEEGMKRVRNIVSDLRMFTHPEGGPTEPVDVAEAVNTSLRFLSGEWKDKVQVEVKVAPGQTVLANRNKLIHVLVNLLQNSLDAMRQKDFTNEKPAISIQGRTEDDRSFIAIRDNGPGIEQKHLNKIFDPFFTTKDVGEGMGLGLSICHRIVQGFDGRISVKTEVGRFCEFALDFPTKMQPIVEEEIEHGEPVRL